MNKIKAGIIGITGYTGEELYKILSRHEGVALSVYTARAEAQQLDMGAKLGTMTAETADAALRNGLNVAFLALPHRVSFGIVPGFLEAGIKVIDLSADFRINSAEEYEKWYGEKHTAAHHLPHAVYGLPELYREKIKAAQLVANPGCYPTTAILGLAPVIGTDLIDRASIIVDAKSGISGAGKKSTKEYFENEHPNFRPYNIGGKHRHTPEMEQELSKLAGVPLTLTFTPQIIPVERGMLSTIYANLKKKVTTAELIERYRERYRSEPFVRVLDEGHLPSIKNVTGTNFCEIGMKVDERTNRLIVASAIDNLVKGASGQAVQNMNIMFGFDERSGF